MNILKLCTKFPARTGIILLILFLVACIILILKFVANERTRDIVHWHSRLGILADLHSSAIDDKLRLRREQIRELSDNPSLQLYLSQYSNTETHDKTIQAVQQSHVRNLLAATADRMGFNIRHDSSVNLSAKLDYGIAVTDSHGKLLMASRGFNQDFSSLNSAIAHAINSGEQQLIDLFLNANSRPTYGFVKPVWQIQATQSSRAMGSVIVLLNPADDLFNLLNNIHLDTSSDETLLLREQHNSLMYISPLKKGYLLFHQIDGQAKVAEAISTKKIGGYVSGVDYRGVEVITTARAINQSPWLLIQKVDSSEALEESNQHQKLLLGGFLLFAGLICSSFIAVWRHSTSNRLQQLSASLEAQAILFKAVSDNIYDIIFLVDENDKFIFANLSFSHILNIPIEEISGRSINNVLGHDTAAIINDIQLNHPMSDRHCVISLQQTHNSASYHVNFVTLTHGQFTNSKLFVLHDITDLKRAEAKRDKLAQGIIGTLIKAVDLHDPYCVDHSSRTREVALSIARELRLEDSRCSTLEMAALLANIGKLFLPRAILTKMDTLTDQENHLLKQHITYAVDILKQLDFPGPVVQIIAQKNEYLDGSGYPHGLSGVDILMESRILSVANAFVAMTSARAYRQGRPITEVLNILLQQCDRHYDRHIVAALFHIAENQADWASWRIAADNPKKPEN